MALITKRMRPPRMMLCIVDETYNWLDKELVEKCGMILGVYMFDVHRAVYCCELTPSFEMLFIRSTPAKWPKAPSGPFLSTWQEQLAEDAWELERQRIDEALRDGDAESPNDVRYFHCRAVNWEEPATHFAGKPCVLNLWQATQAEWNKFLEDNDDDDDAALIAFEEQCQSRALELI